MRIIVTIALVASLLVGCAPIGGVPEWVDKMNKDNTSKDMGG